MERTDTPKTVSHVELIEGAQNITPWGRRDRAGVRFPCTDPEHLRYYATNGRYLVTERVVTRPKTGADKSATATLGTKGRSGPGGGTPITEERLLALAKMEVKAAWNKKRLVAIAADLGVKVDSRNPPNNHQLVRQIQERQAAILAELDNGDGEGEGEPTPE